VVSSNLTGRNTPKDIQVEPARWTVDENGKRHVKPHLPAEEVAAQLAHRLANPIVPIKAPEPTITHVSQAPTEPRWDGYEGIKLYASRALLRAGLEVLARGFEILHDSDLMGRRDVLFSEISERTEPVMGKSGTRALSDIFNGKIPNRHPTNGKYNRDEQENRKKLMDLLVSFAHSSNTNTRGDKTHQKIGKGRPKKRINPPSEGELAQMLIAAGLIERTDINDNNVLKERGDLATNWNYRAKIGVGEHVKRNGEGQYKRSVISNLTGQSLSTVRQDAVKYMAMRVDSMPPNREPYSDKYREALPVDHVELEAWEKHEVIPAGYWFENFLGDQQFEYTQLELSVS
jgi:hypothetical protein